MITNKRLFTFGCSYTQYTIPTWADFLGLEFKNFENWGQAGLGCRAIAERVAECHARNKFTADDIVIVQWSTHLRHDFYTNAPILGRKENWKTFGSVFSYENRPLYDEKWFDTFFMEAGYVLHCLNHMLMIQTMLESIGCTWFMTSIGHWPNLSSDLDLASSAWETWKKKLSGEGYTIKKDFPELSFYIKPIWEDRKDHWIKPIGLDAMTYPKDYLWFHPEGEKPWREQHPSPKQYVAWLNKHLRPKLGLEAPPKEQQMWIDQILKIKKECKDQRDLMTIKFHEHQDEFEYWPRGIWPTEFKGF
jgi:hypothetical protein